MLVYFELFLWILSLTLQTLLVILRCKCKNNVIFGQKENPLKPDLTVNLPPLYTGSSPVSPGSSNNYGTVTRSTSLSIKQQFGHMRNASSASLQTAGSPDDEVEGILHNRFGSERNTSMKAMSRNSLSNTGMGNVPVHGLGGRVPPKKVWLSDFSWFISKSVVGL